MSENPIIVIRRQRHSINPISAVLPRFTARIDGHDVAKLADGRSVSVPVAPGPHVVEVHAFGYQASRSVVVTLAPGETAALSCRPGVLLNVYRLQLELDSPPVLADPGHDPRPAFGPGSGAVVNIQETHRSAEPVGVEYRELANPASGVSMTRTIRATREWTRTVLLEDSRAMTGSLSLGVHPAWLQVQASAEAEIRRMYSISTVNREEFAEELALEIQPNSHVRLALHWKKLWQHGTVLIRGADGTVTGLPYRVQVGLTFDQSVENLRRFPTVT